MGIGICEIFVLLVLVWIISVPFWIISIVDIARSKFRGNDKIVWLLVVILLSGPGVILYRAIGKKQKVVG